MVAQSFSPNLAVIAQLTKFPLAHSQLEGNAIEHTKIKNQVKDLLHVMSTTLDFGLAVKPVHKVNLPST